jgi:adenosylcobinamide-phosphate synthase
VTWGRSLGLVLGYLADAAVGDPRRFHPVAGFGRVALAVETRWYADSRARGALHLTAMVVATALCGTALERASRQRPALHCAVTAVTTWTVLGGRSLAHEAGLVHAELSHGDLPAARSQLRNLVGRDPSRLGPDGVARATVESVAENTSDAVVAPLLWGAVAGPGGLLAYRAVNTLDAMVGHRSRRYERYGWAAARLDDLLNLAPARMSAVVAAVVAPVVGGRPSDALAAWRHDAGRHPSPNAGPVEAAFAGALGITLGGTNTYGTVVEDRGTLGSGPPASVNDVPRAVHLATWIGTVAVSAAAATAIAASRPRRSPWRRLGQRVRA